MRPGGTPSRRRCSSRTLAEIWPKSVITMLLYWAEAKPASTDGPPSYDRWRGRTAPQTSVLSDLFGGLAPRHLPSRPNKPGRREAGACRRSRDAPDHFIGLT